MKGHAFTKTLKAKGQFLYCAGCGLVALSNKATQRAMQKPCIGLKELDDEQYLKLRNQLKGGK
jgi:hypothetical protein